ncbi:uncharacterized protein LOC111331698 [Stylophora pistillata]|uniref:uncharacterized protein LOC111331698 n=1 Tax=Stylophora pistillata TaxID=50429 RepID=UPI000C04D5E9|nr:uncharacterized protein LOC111331698 [Stylophora pistillata]
MDMFTTVKKSCAEIQQVWPEAKSGYYWIKIGSREAQVYCVMTSYGGGWTLVATISCKENSHLHSTEVNCLDSKLCVPFTDKNISAKNYETVTFTKCSILKEPSELMFWENLFNPQFFIRFRVVHKNLIPHASEDLFDGHDDDPGRRALYGYPLCYRNSHGIFLNKSGMLFVK